MWREVRLYLGYLGVPALLAAGLLVAGFSNWWRTPGQTLELRARIAEAGGWSPAAFTAEVGVPVTLRLVADDMDHGFAIGQMAGTRVAMPLGQPQTLTVTFARPGRYMFYCTRWCSPAHWRMRGTIDVIDPNGAAPEAGEPPLYVQLGLDLDAPRSTDRLPAERPNAARGAALGASLPADTLTTAAYRASSPAQIWETLRQAPATQGHSDQAVWEAVAWLWQQQTTPARLAEARQLYADNCAECHGAAGAGDGPQAASLAAQDHAAQAEFGAHTQAPTDFTDAARLLATPPAILHGKLLRGGMGTGMPYWGPLFTDAELWALSDYLWTFQFEYAAE